MKNKLKKILHRVYNDFLMPNRYYEYEAIIKNYQEIGYQFITISEYKKLTEKGKYLIIRHDIDSDVQIAKRMFEIEKRYNVKATYYFRKSTLDTAFMKKINEYGSEVGYHYEEIATYVKKNKIKTKKEILKHIKKIQELFKQNIISFEKDTEIKLCSIAAHGDYINVKYKITNNILFDKEMQKCFPQIIEAYDTKIEGYLDARISDCEYPILWKPITPKQILENDNAKVLMLIHTRWWSRAPIERLKLIINRVVEEIKYKYF